MTDAQQGSEREQWLELVEVPDDKQPELNAAFDVDLDPRLRQLALLAKTGASCWPSACLPTLDDDVQRELDGAGEGREEMLRNYDEMKRALALDIDVIAQLDPQAVPDADALPISKLMSITGDVTGEVGGKSVRIVSGTVAIGKLSVLSASCVRLKSTSPMRTALDRSVPRVLGMPRPSRQAAALPTGHGVIVGIVDFGFDFAQPNFRKPGGGTRVLRLWDQGDGRRPGLPKVGADDATRAGAPPDANGRYAYGCEFTASDIDLSLRPPCFAKDVIEQGRRVGRLRGLIQQRTDPHVTLRYDLGLLGHGTHVADIAAGNGNATGAPGVAPEADLVLVQLPRESLENPALIANSRHLLEGVAYVFDVAEKLGRPAVVNLSIQSQSGPHDGTSLLETAFDAMLDRPGRALVLAAGNGRLAGAHAEDVLEPRGAAGAEVAWQWMIPPDDGSHNAVELWYGEPRRVDDDHVEAVAITLESPGGCDRLGPIEKDRAYAICLRRRDDRAGEQIGDFKDIARLNIPVVGSAFHRRAFRASKKLRDWGEVLITLEGTATNGVSPGVPAGSWTVRIANESDRTVPVDAWIERDGLRSVGVGTDSPIAEAKPSYFIGAACRRTLSALAGGRRTIAVAAERLDDAGECANYSGEGPTRRDNNKPDVCAPGEHTLGIGILAAKAGSRAARRMSGTSMAAPHVTGVVALLLEAAENARQPATAEQLHEAVVAGAAGDKRPRWNARRGYGTVNAAASLAALRKKAPDRR